MMNLKEKKVDDAARTNPEVEAGYGYGTVLHFSKEQANELNLTVVGQKLRIVAFGFIESLHAEAADGVKISHASIQLTDMEASPATTDAASKLYPGA